MEPFEGVCHHRQGIFRSEYFKCKKDRIVLLASINQYGPPTQLSDVGEDPWNEYFIWAIRYEYEAGRVQETHQVCQRVEF